MPSYEHTQILDALDALNQPPSEESDYLSWITAKRHFEMLIHNSRSGEVVLYTSILTRRTVNGALISIDSFAHAVMARESDVNTMSHDNPGGLVSWMSTPYGGRAGFAETPGEPDRLEIDLYGIHPHAESSRRTQNLVFGRELEGLADKDALYFELLQEFAHATKIHWRQEHRAYCRIDDSGEVEPVVSVTKPENHDSPVLITCKREVLEQYLVATGNVLVRFFELLVTKRDKFQRWDGAVEKDYVEPPELFYNQLVHHDGHAWTKAAQVIRPVIPERDLRRSALGSWYEDEDREYASFLIQDWRNRQTVEVSAKPGATTNYFEAGNNSLPFEVSPAFFKPEVLSKYKADRDRYTIDEAHRIITCRGAWELRGYDVNEAGQVHAYICYLRNLPYREQLYWQSHNEQPKGPISKRAIDNDFKGEWSFHVKPLEGVLEILQEWVRADLDWWDVRDASLFHRVNTPLTNSKEEWAQAFQDLSILVVEGFPERAIRPLLSQQGVLFEKNERSLALLEKLLNSMDTTGGENIRLQALREAQQIRTKVRAHGGGSEGEELARDALTRFGTYRGHFENVCDRIAGELKAIEVCIGEKSRSRTDQDSAQPSDQNN